MKTEDFVNELAFKAKEIPEDEQKSILKDAVLFCDDQTKLVVAMEELAELQKELSKMYREEGDLFALLEEMADVALILEQLKLIYHITPETFELAKNIKLQHIQERLYDM